MRDELELATKSTAVWIFSLAATIVFTFLAYTAYEIRKKVRGSRRAREEQDQRKFVRRYNTATTKSEMTNETLGHRTPD